MAQPGIGAAGAAADQQADADRAVAGGVKHAQIFVAQRRLVAVAQGAVREGDVGGLVQVDGGAGARMLRLRYADAIHRARAETLRRSVTLSTYPRPIRRTRSRDRHANRDANGWDDK